MDLQPLLIEYGKLVEDHWDTVANPTPAQNAEIQKLIKANARLQAAGEFPQGSRRRRLFVVALANEVLKLEQAYLRRNNIPFTPYDPY